MIPVVADEAGVLDERLTNDGVGCIDQCLLWAKGGVWHTKQMTVNIVPLPTIDTEATWGYTPYRHRWVFGYGLHAIVNRFRFPCAASVTNQPYAHVTDRFIAWYSRLISAEEAMTLYGVGNPRWNRAFRSSKNCLVSLTGIICPIRAYRKINVSC